MAVVTLNFDAHQYQTMLNSGLNIDAFITTTLKEDAQGVIAICDHLRANHTTEGGSPDVTDFEITNADYNLQANQGKVHLKYQVHYVWGCSGINNSQTAKESCPFTIDASSSILTLTIPLTPVRDTFEEF